MLSGLVGETVVVIRHDVVKLDRYNNRMTADSRTPVRNVLVDRPTTSDINGSRLGATDRPNGDRIAFTLHFPKDYTASLRGCSVVVRGKTYNVVGDPQPYMDKLTPGRWNRPVEVEVVDG